jgi:hypothetical protein
MFDLTWEEKLAFLVQQDHQMTEILQERGVLSDTYHPELEKVHLNNARRLSEMIDKMGFPVLSNAGEKGVRLSWLIIQHAISWPSFMKDCLLQMRLASSQNDYILELLAYTEDRVAFFEGRSQLYGTNFDWIDDELKRTPVEDAEKLNVRRKSLGLPPVLDDVYPGQQERPPKDPVKKSLEFKAWLVRTGWKSA